MKQNRKLYYIVLTATALVLAVLCVGLWGLSSAAEKKDTHVFPVHISEVCAANTGYPDAAGRYCDYVELHNDGTFAVDISGYRLTDGGKESYRFPEGTVLSPDGYILVYCAREYTGEDFAPFGLSRMGDEEVLFLTQKGVVLHRVAVAATEEGQTLVQDSEGNWVASPLGTPGYPNTEAGYAAYMTAVGAPPSPLHINEIMTRNSLCPDAYGETWDWIELYNAGNTPLDISGYTLSDKADTAKYTFPEGSVAEADSYILLQCTTQRGGECYAPFCLSGEGGETVWLRDKVGRTVDFVETLPLEKNQVMVPDEKGWKATDMATPGHPNTREGREAYLTTLGLAHCGVRFTEVMPVNKATLADGFGEFSDWAELTNFGTETFDLSGCYLTDDDNPTKWPLPPRDLAPGEVLLVYCSGRDTEKEGEIHAGFSLSSTGECLRLVSAAGTVLDSFSFGPGEADVSFCRGEGEEMTATAFPTPGYTNDAAGYTAFCSSCKPAGPLAIWEVMTGNQSYLPQALGRCYDWVELQNISDSPLNLSDYCLTDKAHTPDRFRLPERELLPGQRTVILLSGDTSLSNERYTHGNFSLNDRQDRLYLYTAEGTLTDFVLLDNLPYDRSYGRNPGEGGFFITPPTPGEENASGERRLSTTPTASLAPGLYATETGLDIALTAAGPIYYTLDGSTPDSSAALYTGPIHLDQTTVLRAVTVEEGMYPSETLSLSYFLNVEHELPVFSMITDPNNLFGSRRGIYTHSATLKEIEIPVSLSCFDGEESFSLDCGVTMHGATSLLVQKKKSFNVYFRNRYGGALHYDLFHDGRVTDFASIVLRADQESTYSSYIRDNLLSSIGLQYSDSMLAANTGYGVLYINGEYWGIYSIRERYSEAFYASHMGFPEDTVRIVKHYTEPGQSLYDEVFTFVKNHDMRREENYLHVLESIDPVSFADWMIFEAWCGNFDINGNMRYCYSTVDGKWRCGLNDVDLGMFRKDTFSMVFSTTQAGVIPQRLLDNEAFQQLFRERLVFLLSEGLSDAHVTATIEGMAAQLRAEMPREKARWGGTPQQWEAMVRGLKNYTAGRAGTVAKDGADLLQLSREERETYLGGILDD